MPITLKLTRIGNSQRLAASRADATPTMPDAAADALNEASLAQWLRGHSRPREAAEPVTKSKHFSVTKSKHFFFTFQTAAACKSYN